MFVDEFCLLFLDYCDVLFCNVDEVCSFCKKDFLDDFVKSIGELVEIVFIINGKEGCLVVKDK